MDRTGLAPAGDDLGVRWVAVRHAADHIHLVATLARQDGTRPKIWNDFYRVREACQAAETRFGLRATAPADRTAARRPARAETEQAARRGWAEPPRVTLRREVSAAAAGARSEQEFFARLAEAGVAVRKRYSTTSPGEVTGYAVGLPRHTAKDGGIVWFGGGKLAADLTLPKLRRRWTAPAAEHGAFPGCGLSAAAARAVLRKMVSEAADQARDEAGFFARLREAGVLVRLRFSETNPGQVTGYAVALPGQDGGGGAPRLVWRGPAGGRADLAAAAVTLGPPEQPRRIGPERSGSRSRSGTRSSSTRPARPPPPRNTSGVRPAVIGPGRLMRRGQRPTPCMSQRGRCAARSCAARRTPTTAPPAPSTDRSRAASREGSQLRAAARLMALTGPVTGDATLVTVALIANLVALAVAVAELREAQQHAAQAAAARRQPRSCARLVSGFVHLCRTPAGQRRRAQAHGDRGRPRPQRRRDALASRASSACWPGAAWPRPAPSTAATPTPGPDR